MHGLAGGAGHLIVNGAVVGHRKQLGAYSDMKMQRDKVNCPGADVD